MNGAWGFCGHCHREEPVEDGLIVVHDKSAAMAKDVMCLGSNHVPAMMPSPDIKPDSWKITKCHCNQCRESMTHGSSGTNED